jgi:hypothetical protein
MAVLELLLKRVLLVLCGMLIWFLPWLAMTMAFKGASIVAQTVLLAAIGFVFGLAMKRENSSAIIAGVLTGVSAVLYLAIQQTPEIVSQHGVSKVFFFSLVLVAVHALVLILSRALGLFVAWLLWKPEKPST